MSISITNKEDMQSLVNFAGEIRENKTDTKFLEKITTEETKEAILKANKLYLRSLKKHDITNDLTQCFFPNISVEDLQVFAGEKGKEILETFLSKFTITENKENPKTLKSKLHALFEIVFEDETLHRLLEEQVDLYLTHKRQNTSSHCTELLETIQELPKDLLGTITKLPIGDLHLEGVLLLVHYYKKSISYLKGLGNLYKKNEEALGYAEILEVEKEKIEKIIDQLYPTDYSEDFSSNEASTDSDLESHRHKSGSPLFKKRRVNRRKEASKPLKSILKTPSKKKREIKKQAVKFADQIPADQIPLVEKDEIRTFLENIKT